MLESWNFSPKALIFIESLVQEQAPGSHLLINIEQGGTYQAQLSLKLEQASRLNQDNLYQHPLSSHLSCYTHLINLPFLKDLSITFKENLLGGELEIDAPFLYGKKSKRSLLEDIELFFAQELLPYLKQHNGSAILEKITPDHQLVLKFEGGCQGCSMAKITLKQGIEEKIKQRFPEIQGIIDMTDHSQGEQPYA